MKLQKIFYPAFVAFILMACNPASNEGNGHEASSQKDIESMINQYTTVRLESDLSQLSEKQRQMMRLLIDAARIMDGLFWQQAYGNREELLSRIDDEATRKYVMINYGPWDRLNGNAPFVKGVGPKPKGANFYPQDMTQEEYEAANLPEKGNLYTFLRRDEQGNLKTVWYHEAFRDSLQQAAKYLLDAAELAEDPGLAFYLTLRAEALMSDNYYASDVAWLDMKNNRIDIVIGPIETYEDQLFGQKASYEAYVLLKDMDWSQRLQKYAAFLPGLQQNLPVDEAYKQEKPGTDAELNAYDVIYYAGDCNAGSKTIAINLPNDERVQLRKGTRRLQLKNAMRAKFDRILLPIADVLIAPDQRSHITFDAFFANTMFHEVAHGLGIKNTITGKGTVREALKEQASALEEGKADILGLYMVTELLNKGELEGDIMDYYVTFMASIFRSIRFGASSAHGRANMLRFNYFMEQGAFTRGADGTYRVNPEKFAAAVQSLSNLILTLQGDGDYEGVKKLMEEKGVVGEQLQADLQRLADENIPVDIVFEQGKEVLGL